MYRSPWAAPISRRRMLATTGAGMSGVLAAALIGCSAGNKTPAAAPAGPSAATKAAPVSDKPKSGGTIKYALGSDLESLDPTIYRGTNTSTHQANVYSQLFVFETGDGKPSSGKVVGDLAATCELPDPTTLIVHLNPKAKFDQREPLNGRVVNAEDVVQTWKRVAANATLAPNISNARNKEAPVVAIEAVDPSTVRIKLARPDALLMPILATNLNVIPAEGASGKIDLTKEMRGTGPFVLERYQRSVAIEFKRNPTWHGGPDRPYVDGIKVSLVPDRAQMEVQFRSKNLHFGAVSAENIPQFARDLKDSEIAVGAPNHRSGNFGPSYAPGQPWHDVRVRRAVSMSMDRDKFAEVLFNPKDYDALGVKLTVRWNAPFAGGYGAFWIDPKGKDFGPSAQWLKHNVAEAKKLLEAAGYTAQKPLEFDMVYPGVYYGRDWPTRVDTFLSMAAETGAIKFKHASIDYTKYIAGYWRGGAKFDGVNQKNGVQFPPGGAAASTALEWLISYFTPKGVSTATADAWPEVEKMLTKLRTVSDFEGAKAGVHEVQRYVVENMIVVPVGPLTQTTDLVWDKLHGYGEIQGWPGGKAGVSEYFDFWMEEQI